MMAECEPLVLHAEDGRDTRWKQSGPQDAYRYAGYFLQKDLWLRVSGADIQSRLCFPSCVPGETLAFYFPQRDPVLLNRVAARLLLPAAVAFLNVFKGAT